MESDECTGGMERTGLGIGKFMLVLAVFVVYALLVYLSPFLPDEYKMVIIFGSYLLLGIALDVYENRGDGGE